MIVAVGGGKGGVGKSTIAVNLGSELDAVVVDADLATADLPRGNGPDLHEVLAGRAGPIEGVEQVGSVRYLSCGRTLAGAHGASLDDLPRVLDRLEREYGRVVVDCPAGLARDIGTVFDCAHAAVLVTTPTRPALVDALRVRELARDVETPIAAIVCNRADGSDLGDLSARVDDTLGATTAVIEDQPAVAQTIAEGRPVREVAPNCDAVAAFETVAESIDSYAAADTF